jgi:CheY-like chemotaxis protein
MKHVLVVDDEEAITYIFRRYLQAAGYRVTTAADGVEALAFFDAHVDSDPVDALITDIRMPRMGGEALIAQLRPRFPDLPVIVVSAYPNEFGCARGNTQVLSKPVDAATLLASLGKMLGDRDPAPAI